MEGELSLFKKVIDMYYDIKQGCQNMKYWFSSIWKDRDWEPENMYTIIVKKLDKMIDYFESSKCMCTFTKKEIRKMKICRNALKSLLSNRIKLDMSYLRVIYRYNNIPVENYTEEELFYDVQANIGGGGLLQELANKRTSKFLQTGFSKNKYKEIFNRCWEHDAYMEKQAMELFTKYFRYSNRWWD